MDNNEIGKINKKKLLLGGLLRFLECELIGFFVFLFYSAVSVAMGLVANIIFGVVGIIVLMCIMADYGLKEGEKARNKVSLRGAKPCRYFGAAIGSIAMAPNYLTLLLLALSKAGVIGNFLPAYKLLNVCFFPIIDIVAHTADINEMNPLAFILFAIMPLFYLVSSWVSFKWGYDKEDIETKIVYKNNKK